MPSVSRLYTVADVRAMPDDGNRYEVIEGELFVTPAPNLRHQRLIGRLYLALGNYVTAHELGDLFMAPTDVVLGPTTLIQPDILFVRRDRAKIMTEQEVTEPPDLAIEVLSPSSARTDRGRKRALYQGREVAEYWVVDGDHARVEVWRPGALEAEVRTDELRWQPDPPDPQVPALLIDLRQVLT